MSTFNGQFQLDKIIDYTEQDGINLLSGLNLLPIDAVDHKIIFAMFLRSIFENLLLMSTD